MLELRVKKIIDVSTRFDGDAVITILADRGQNGAVNKAGQAIGKDLLGYVIRLLKPKKKRSLDANAYMWVLCDKIAEKIQSTKEAVYQSAIRSVGVFTDVQVPEEAVKSLASGWEHNGTGWFAELVDSVADVKTVRLYYGSSTYDSKQMARLIDEVIVYCKDFDIEYLPPDELERMMQQWGAG
ncbi:hypothetical protein NIA71_19685 [Ihubacter massiliensis]|uniref:hypothetical protein n=1 Tax=Ihubacter massiliensis TaxID=1852367 RepID=UPI002097A8A4|nr:hypothetical protein [Ihubacter massiliensis]MCO7124143.1 hypothetical protein [Ihubacter massiliensis]MDY3013514.1 hypothetical protein [Clostridiales Family XIII bacterium]